MPDRRSLEERLAAVERALTDGHAVEGLPDAAQTEDRLDDLAERVERVDDRVADLEAAVQALRGFAGGVRAVDESVERRADAALAAVDRLESDLRDLESRIDGERPADEASGDAGLDSEVGGDPTDDPSPRTNDRPPGRDGRPSDPALVETVAGAAEGLPSDDAEPTGLAARLRRLL